MPTWKSVQYTDIYSHNKSLLLNTIIYTLSCASSYSYNTSYRNTSACTCKYVCMAYLKISGHVCQHENTLIYMLGDIMVKKIQGTDIWIQLANPLQYKHFLWIWRHVSRLELMFPILKRISIYIAKNEPNLYLLGPGFATKGRKWNLFDAACPFYLSNKERTLDSHRKYNICPL